MYTLEFSACSYSRVLVSIVFWVLFDGTRIAECNVTVELRGDRRRLRRVATAVLRSPLPRTRFPPLRLAHCFFEGTAMNKFRTGW